MIINYERSIVDIVLEHGKSRPDRVALIYDPGTHPLSQYTYAELAMEIRRLAGGLIERGLAGRRIAMLFSPGAQFVLSLLACLAAGSVAVPLAPIGRRRSRVQNLTAMLSSLKPDCLLLDTAMVAQFGSELLSEMVTGSNYYLEYSQLDEATAHFQPLACSPDSLAVLQYTSGTTSQSKGVMITHGNIIANETMIRSAFGHDEDSHFVGWVPHFHDQGLFGNILQPLFLGSTCVLTSPAAFINKPMSWLQLISKYGAHSSGGPNFGYDLCADHAVRRGVPDIDLSSWKVAFNGAERVRSGTLERFAACFAGAGFDQRAFLPCYGLAESTLVTVAPRPWRIPLVRGFDSAALSRGIACSATDCAPSIDLVCCGPAMVPSEIVIVEGFGKKRSPDGVVGEIWVQGPHIAHGYLGDDEATAETFGAFLDTGEGPFLRTGDLGFATPDGIYIVGRLKDLIILRGRKYAPSDVELIWSGISAMAGQASAAAVQIEIEGAQHVALIAECKRADVRKVTKEALEVTTQILRGAVMETLELSLTNVIIVPEGSIPRTTSGKVQRVKAAQMIMTGEIPIIRVAGPLALVLETRSPTASTAARRSHKELR
jgi:acyl-CoA synthetase (AMP-forming)/AMP-acid ligase II